MADLKQLTQEDFRVFGIDKEVFDAFKIYAKLKANGKYSLAIRRLLEESAYLSLLSNLSMRVGKLEQQNQEPPPKKFIKTMGGKIEIPVRKNE